MSSAGDAAPLVADVIATAWVGYEELVALGEEIEDEWSYVNDLAEAWRSPLVEVEEVRGREAASGELIDAVAALAAEAAEIEDAHRAIDWLSTYPQVLLIALGEQP